MRPNPLPFVLTVVALLAAGSSPARSVQVLDTATEAYWTDGVEPALQDEGPLAAEVGETVDPFGGIGNGARATASAGPDSVRLSARAAVDTTGYDNPHAPPFQTWASTRVDFSISSATYYVLSASGANLRVVDVGDQQDGVDIQLSSEWSTSQQGAFRSGSFVQPFGVSSAGVLSSGDHWLSLDVLANSVEVPVTEDEQGNPIVTGAAVFDSRAQVILGFGSVGEAVAGGGTLVFDSSVPGTTTSSYSTTGDLASVLSMPAASSADFLLPGSEAQVWEIDFSGELDGAATLQLAYDASLLDVAEELLAIQHFDEDTGTWELLSGVVDAQNDLITFETTSFSPFVLATIPEPGTATLLGLGLGMLGYRRRRIAQGARAR